MLTSHELLVANQKRQKKDKNRHGKDVNGNVEHSTHDPLMGQDDFNPLQNKPKKRKEQPNNQKSGQHRGSRHGYRRRHQNNRDRQEAKQNKRQDYPEGYVPQVEEGKVYEGIVQNYYREKGYGFIRSDDFEVPAFFHYSEIQLDGFKYLIKQQKVEFKARVSDDGKLQGYEVTPTELAPTQKRQIFSSDDNKSESNENTDNDSNE